MDISVLRNPSLEGKKKPPTERNSHLLGPELRRRRVKKQHQQQPASVRRLEKRPEGI
jgi:hypothetical protein